MQGRGTSGLAFLRLCQIVAVRLGQQRSGRCRSFLPFPHLQWVLNFYRFRTARPLQWRLSVCHWCLLPRRFWQTLNDLLFRLGTLTSQSECLHRFSLLLCPDEVERIRLFLDIKLLQLHQNPLAGPSTADGCFFLAYFRLLHLLKDVLRLDNSRVSG